MEKKNVPNHQPDKISENQLKRFRCRCHSFRELQGPWPHLHPNGFLYFQPLQGLVDLFHLEESCGNHPHLAVGKSEKNPW